MFKLNKFLISLLIIVIIFIEQAFANAKENSAAVFIYHRFGENKYPSTNIKISQFKKHIEELTNNNYNVIPIEQIIDAFINKKNRAVARLFLFIAVSLRIRLLQNSWRFAMLT